MMKSQYAQYIFDMLKPQGHITIKALFGGYAFYNEGVIFAIIVDDQLYFKVDDETRADFEAYQSEQFIYQGKSKEVSMPYMTLPESILENSEELALWVAKACNVSLRAKKPQKTGRKKAVDCVC